MNEPIQVHIIVSGWVQGVGFRWYAQKKARALDVRGFVRNLPDGTVEIMAQGAEDAVNELMEWCREGSPSARVTSVKTERVGLNEFSDFFTG